MRTVAKCSLALFAFGLAAFFNAGCSEKGKTDRTMEKADRYFDAGDYEKAEVEYLNLSQLNTTNGYAMGRLGRIYHAQGRISRASFYLTESGKLMPNDVEIKLKLGNIDLATGKLKEARDKALAILAAVPKHPEAPFLLAESAITPQEITDARKRLDQLVAQSGDSAPLQLAYAILFLREKNTTAAESSIKRALALDPKSSAAHFAMANLYLSKNDLKNAEASYKTAAEVSPVRSLRHLGYANFKLKTGQLEDAKKLLAEITKQAPDFLPAWTAQADIAFVEKRYNDAEALINQSLSREAVNLEALLLRGRLLMAQGHADKAVTDLEYTSKLFQNLSPQIQYNLALAHLLSNNDTNRALAAVDKAVALNTGYAEAVVLQARLNISRGQPALAIKPLTQLIKQQPEIFEAHVMLAEAYLAQNRANDAIAVFQQMTTLYPNSAEPQFLLSTVLLQQNKTTEARKALEKSRELAPQYIPALERLVDLDLKEKQYAAARERVKKQTEKYPQTAEPWLLLAKIDLVEKDLGQAEAALTKAIDLNPNLATSYQLLVQIYLGSNRPKEALQKLNALVEKRTNNVLGFLQIGMLQDRMQNYPAARDAYEKVLTINSNMTTALNNLAYLYAERLVDLDKAYTISQRARQLQPNDPNTADTLGWVLYKRGDYARALPLLTESAAALSTNPEVQFHLGMAYYMSNQRDNARSLLQRVVENAQDFPGKEDAKKRLALLAVDLKTADANTLNELERALKSQPNDPIALNLVSAIYEKNGDLDKAVKSYRAALSQNPQNVQAMLGLIRLYTGRLNEPRKALELAKEAHNLAPDDSYISQVLGRLVSQEGDYKYAVSLFQDAFRRAPDQPELRYDTALALYNVGQVPEAETRMQDAVQKGSTKLDEAKKFLMFVDAARNPAHTQAAAIQAEQSLKSDPKSIPALTVLATLQQQQGKMDPAKRTYEKVLEVNPLFTPALRNLALLYFQTEGNDQKAYDLALKARAAFPDDPVIARALGILAYRKNDYARATQFLKEATQKEKNDADSFYYLGMAHYRLKQTKESKSALQQAVALNLESKLAVEAKRVLAELK